MDTQIKISVVVPVYNLQDELERCVTSIERQTHNNLEIILVNDGSTDRSWKIISQLAESDNRIIPINKNNGGVTSARIAGIAVASGEYIGFVDGDDEIEEDMYSLLLENAIKYHADISHCGYQMVFPDGRVNYFYNTGLLTQQGKIEALKELLTGERIEPGLGNKLFHKNLFYCLLHDEVVPSDIKINEDLLMNYYLFRGAECSVFDDVCKYHYLVRNSSATRTRLNMHRIYDPIRVKEIILDNAAEEIKESASKAYISTVINVYNSLMMDYSKQFFADEAIIRKKIVEHRRLISLIRNKQKLQAYLLICVPGIYKPFYRFYGKYFLKSKYT